MWTYWLKTLYDFWYEGCTPYLVGFYFWQEWLFQYYNELALCEAIESAYLVWKSEQHKLAPKYEIMGSLVLLLKHYNFNVEENGNKFKITCQRCNGCVTCSGGNVELFYINFLHSVMSTLGLCPEELFLENLYSRWPTRNKMQCMYQKILK